MTSLLSRKLWPSEVTKCLPKRFKTVKNVRIIIDCLELLIQKPKILLFKPKYSRSSYKHWDTAKLSAGIVLISICQISE